MSQTFEIDAGASIVRIVVHGAVTPDEERRCLADILEDPDHRAGFGLLLDNRERRPAATADHVRTMATLFELHHERIGKARLAIVVARDVSYGLARMFASLTAELSLETGVFADPSEAEVWLRDGARGS